MPHSVPSRASWTSSPCGGMERTVFPRACLPSSKASLCPMQQECCWWWGFQRQCFHRAMSSPLGRMALSVSSPATSSCLFMRYGSACIRGLWLARTLDASQLTIWRSGGGWAAPCWPGFPGAPSDWRSGQSELAVHSPALEWGGRRSQKMRKHKNKRQFA